jgi:hypothetical protein
MHGLRQRGSHACVLISSDKSVIWLISVGLSAIRQPAWILNEHKVCHPSASRWFHTTILSLHLVCSKRLPQAWLCRDAFETGQGLISNFAVFSDSGYSTALLLPFVSDFG